MAHVQLDTFDLRGYETDAHRFLTIPALMNLMQESANRNAVTYGIGIADLAQRGYGWMLMRFRLRMHQYPRYGQTIRVITYPTFVDKYFIYRDFRVLADDDMVLADATSTWLAFSAQKRTMTPLPDFIRAIRVPPNINPTARLPLKPDFSTNDFEPDTDRLVEVGWFAIDQNQHVNNVTYVQWLLETVHPATLRTQELHEIDLVYRTESHWGDSLRVQSVAQTAATWLHRIRHSESGQDVVTARSQWRNRTENAPIP